MLTKKQFHPRRVLLTLLLTLFGLCVAGSAFSWNGFTFVEWWRENHSGRVLHDATGREKVIALTFDDGPDARYTPRVLAILRRYNAKATFFVIGKRIRQTPELARQIVREGHALGNHTDTHPYLERLSATRVRQELSACEQAIETTTHLHSHLFRPPHGAWNPTIYREAKREDDRLILWTVALEHHEVRTPKAMTERALRLLRPGGILLMHDSGDATRENTIRALPLLLDALKKRGYRFVTIPELLHIPGDDLLTGLPTQKA